MTENIYGIIAAAIFLSFFSIIITILIISTKALIKDVFKYNYDEIKSKITETPRYIFRARTSITYYKWFFYTDIEVYKDFIIFKMNDRALLVKERAQLELTGKFLSTLIIKSKHHFETRFVLSNDQYNIIKNFLEGNND